MALQIRRGTDSQRTANGFVPRPGELIYTTDTKDLFIGDGNAVGGTQVAPVKSVNGVAGAVVLTTDTVAEGNTNKYYNATQARIDAGAALTAGNAGNVGISFTYNSGTNTINATVTNNGGLSAVVNDTTPSLGGNLNLNSHDITGSGNISTTGGVNVSGSLATANLTLDGNTITSSSLGGASNNALIRLGTLAPTTAGQGTTVAVNQAGANPTLYVKNITSNSFGGISRIQFDGLGTSFASPALPALGDYLGGMAFGALNLAGTSLPTGLIVGQVDPNGTIDSALADGKLVFLASGRSGGNIAIKQMTFDSLGRLAVNQATATATLDVNGDVKGTLFYAGQQASGTDFNNGYTFSGTEGGHDTGVFSPGDGIVTLFTNSVEKVRVDSGGMRVDGFMKVKNVAGTLPSPAEAGMIVLDGTTFKGYNGSAWVTLG